MFRFSSLSAPALLFIACLNCAMTPRETKEQVACGVILRREGEFPGQGSFNTVSWGCHEHLWKMPHGFRGGQGGTELERDLISKSAHGEE